MINACMPIPCLGFFYQTLIFSLSRGTGLWSCDAAPGHLGEGLSRNGAVLFGEQYDFGFKDLAG